MTLIKYLSIFPAIAITFHPMASIAKNLTPEFDAKHKVCLERIAVDAELAFEEAMIWRDDGGGRRAKHCEAMALFALDQIEEAAFRLDTLAKAADGGDPSMRVGYYLEAANFWILAGNARKAYESATDGLKLNRESIDLRIARARAYALLERYEDAETDLTNALLFNGSHADALRYRADARRKQGNLEDAKSDIEASLLSDPTRVETAVVRGEIIEAIRLKVLVEGWATQNQPKDNQD